MASDALVSFAMITVSYDVASEGLECCGIKYRAAVRVPITFL